MTERVIDPGALHGVSLITSSHAHTDHFDPDTLGPLLDDQPRRAAPRRAGESPDRLRTTR